VRPGVDSAHLRPEGRRSSAEGIPQPRRDRPPGDTKHDRRKQGESQSIRCEAGSPRPPT
jgi:hypothetical protein